MKHTQGKHVANKGKTPFTHEEKAHIPSDYASQGVLQKHQVPPPWLQPRRENAQNALGNLRRLSFRGSGSQILPQVSTTSGGHLPRGGTGGDLGLEQFCVENDEFWANQDFAYF